VSLWHLTYVFGGPGVKTPGPHPKPLCQNGHYGNGLRSRSIGTTNKQKGRDGRKRIVLRLELHFFSGVEHIPNNRAGLSKLFRPKVRVISTKLRKGNPIVTLSKNSDYNRKGVDTRRKQVRTTCKMRGT